MIPPLAKVTDMVNVPPVAAAPVPKVHVSALLPTVTPVKLVIAIDTGVPVKVIVALLTVVAALPVFDKVTVQVVVVVVTGHEAVPVTLAPEVNDPNRPNTNPAMAMAAMSVMAMRMTVAMTGDIPFL